MSIAQRIALSSQSSFLCFSHVQGPVPYRRPYSIFTSPSFLQRPCHGLNLSIVSKAQPQRAGRDKNKEYGAAQPTTARLGVSQTSLTVPFVCSLTLNNLAYAGRPRRPISRLWRYVKPDVAPIGQGSDPASKTRSIGVSKNETKTKLSNLQRLHYLKSISIHSIGGY